MKLRVQDKLKAIELRMEGLSYKEIMGQIPVSKGTLSGWLKYIKLSTQQEERLHEKITIRSNIGRANGAITNRRKRQERENKIIDEARVKFQIYENDPFFTFGVTMYWAEGAKKSSMFQFMNSDPKIILLMTEWMERYIGLKRAESIFFRLYIHDVYSHENCEDFWVGYLGINKDRLKKTIYKPTPHLIKRNPEYKGCMRIEVYRVNLLYLMRAWQNMLANKLSLM